MAAQGRTLPLCAQGCNVVASFRPAVGLGAAAVLGKQYGHGNKYGRPAIASVLVSGFKNPHAGGVAY